MAVYPNRSVLVCEDDPAMVRIFQFLLRQHGILNVLTTASGNEVLKIAQRELPAMILLDMMLPDKEGIAVLKELKQDNACRSIPVVVVSGKEADDHVREAMDAGAVGYVVKPFEPTELGGRIRDFLDNMRSFSGNPSVPPTPPGGPA